MSNSINTNIAAFYAQENITTASNAATENVAQLSSGNAIINASDNVAALAVGTSIGTQVSILNAAQNNAAQGTSLLQVADGALAQIQSILQQQQSIANQAQSGSLTNTDRGFLNEEFQTLSNEINALASGTTFNGVSLINGAIAGGAAINTNINTGSTALPISAAIGTIGTVVSGDTFTLKVGGQPTQTFTFGTASGDVGIGASASDSAANLAAAINNSGIAELSNVRVVATGANLTAYYTGSASSLSNIPAIVSGTNDATTITSTGTASFGNGTTLATFTGNNIANGDTFVIGSHTITFDANGTNSSGYNASTGAVDIGTGGTVNSTALTNLAAYLNAVAGTTGFTDIGGITFKADSTHLYGIYTSGGATQPVLTTSYSGGAQFTGVTSGAVSNSTAVLTVADIGDIVNGGSGVGSVLTIGGATISFGGASSGLTTLTPTVVNTGTLSTTLANIASYLNGSTVNAELTGGYAGLVFTSDGTHVYATNNTANVITGGNTTFSNALPASDTGSSGGSVAAAGTDNVITLGGANLNAGDTIVINGVTLTMIAHGQSGSNVSGSAGTVALGTSVANTLTALATYFNTNAVALGFSASWTGTVFSSDATHLIATNNSAGALTAPAATLGAGQPNDVTPVTAPSLTASSLVGTFSGTGLIAVGDSMTIAGQTFTIVASGASGNQVNVGATNAATLANLVSVVNANATIVADDLTFSTSSSKLYAQNNLGGTAGSTTVTTAFTGNAAATFTGVTNQTVAADSVSGLGAGTTTAIGTPTGSLFVQDTGTSATNFGNGVDLSKVANNTAFIGAFGGTGTIGAITGNYINTGTQSTSGVQFSVVVGNDTYTTGTITNATLNGTAPVAVTFTGANTTTDAAEGGSFTLSLQPQADVTSQTGANQLATGLNTALSGVDAYQNRNVLSYNNNYTAVVGGVQKATLAGSSLTFNSNSFTSPSISSISVSAPSTGSTDAKITAVVNGDTYTTVSGIGDTFSANQEIVLENQSNPDQTLTLTFGTAGSADLSSASNAAAFQTALTNALGVSTSSGGLVFQLGSTSAANVNVTIANATTSSLYNGASLDVSTATDAATAATAITTALNTVTSIRSNVGALETQFNFAAAALQSSVQNESAAQSQLLDTNIATVSTQFATNQVKIQAGISVLAQANQQTQALLKLIG